MKLIDIIQVLENEGHRISYRVRADGGLIIKSIDGKKYKSLTEGNRTARSMVVGGELSMARASQLSFNVNKYIKLKKGEHKAKGSIDEELNRELKKVQRLWRTNEIKGQGRISKKKLRYYIRTEGKGKALEYLMSRERYARGIANEANIEFLCQRLYRLAQGRNADYFPEIDSLVEEIRSMKDSFLERWIEPCNNIAYNKALTIEEKIRQIREIIGRPE